MSYAVYRTDKANEQLYDIFYYIAADSGSTERALEYLDKIEAGILRLKEFPYLGSAPRYRVLKRQGYRVLIVERHLVFYKVYEQEKKIIVYAVIDGKREYARLI